MKKIVISERIKQYRREQNLTQEEFGRIVPVSPQAISKWERGDCYPDITLLPLLAKTLSCSINDFFE